MVKKEIQTLDPWETIEGLPKEQRERVFALLNVPLSELIERWAKSQTYQKAEEEKSGDILNNDYYDAPYAIRELLGIPSVEELNNAIKEINALAEEIDAKLRNHRHDTTKQYSAKPEF